MTSRGTPSTVSSYSRNSTPDATGAAIDRTSQRERIETSISLHPEPTAVCAQTRRSPFCRRDLRRRDEAEALVNAPDERRTKRNRRVERVVYLVHEQPPLAQTLGAPGAARRVPLGAVAGLAVSERLYLDVVQARHMHSRPSGES